MVQGISADSPARERLRLAGLKGMPAWAGSVPEGQAIAGKYGESLLQLPDRYSPAAFAPAARAGTEPPHRATSRW